MSRGCWTWITCPCRRHLGTVGHRENLHLSKMESGPREVPREVPGEVPGGFPAVRLERIRHRSRVVDLLFQLPEPDP